jgi:hypothetical protein
MALGTGAVAAVLVLDPGLDGGVLLSSYADPGTMILVGALGLLGVELLALLAGRSTADAVEIAWRFGFVAAALLNLKQGNPVLLTLIVAGLALVVLFDPDIRVRRVLALLPTYLARPSASTYFGAGTFSEIFQPERCTSARSPTGIFPSCPHALQPCCGSRAKTRYSTPACGSSRPPDWPLSPRYVSGPGKRAGLR